MMATGNSGLSETTVLQKAKQPASIALLQAGFLLDVPFRPNRQADMFPPKRQLTLTGPHGVTSQKTELFAFEHPVALCFLHVFVSIFGTELRRKKVKAQRGCKGPRFRDLGTSWRRVDNFTPLPLYPLGKMPSVPIE
jgi:hypothetical protein